MPYDITLRFDDEDAAKQFTDFHINYPSPDFAVINVQAVPTSSCTCGGTRPKHFTQGRIYGWWVCPICNRVTQRVLEKFGYFGFGYNLIPASLLNYLGVEPLVESPKEWKFLGR